MQRPSSTILDPVQPIIISTGSGKSYKSRNRLPGILKSLRECIPMIKKMMAISMCMFTCAGISYGTIAATEPDLVSVFDSRVYRDLFGTEAMRSVFSDRAMVEQWLRVEVALAEAQAELEIIPASADRWYGGYASTVR